MTDAKKMALLACEALEDKKASDIKVIDIEQITTLADYFIIASGSNRNQVQAMADNVDEVLGKAGYQLKQTEGYSSANWILLDYGDIVIHLFDEENRLFYDLERIWRDGKVMDAKELKERTVSASENLLIYRNCESTEQLRYIDKEKSTETD